MIDILTGQNLFSPLPVLIRLLFSILSGFLIGFERERQYQPAGLRTHMVLSLGSCLIMILSLYIPSVVIKEFPNADPGRLAAQVISGIGFLGAGAIFRYGFNVKGLTTAASIWTTSGIGLTFGAGFYLLGSISTILLIIILQVFDKMESILFNYRHMRILSVLFYSDKLDANLVIQTIKGFDLDIKNLSIFEDIAIETTEIIINCRMNNDFSMRQLFNSIKALGNIKTIKIE